jgi:SpoVK/Ycf46/Vps4 family AAA+-type ATPase
MKILKKWARIRRTGFSDAARAFGLPMPKGLLITGISGCGKSLAIQALAADWKLPLLRLDMGRVFAGFAGSPEESMRRAIMTVEAVAPAILWIDEIEMGVSVFSDSVESGSTARIFASFLTWMQEKSAPVFIAATANDIDRLPPEMIRKGRFDEVFFVDLPVQEEREQIFKIHLTKRGKTITDISLENLAHHAEGFTGAEIEQCIINAMYFSFSKNRDLAIADIYQSMGETIPLSVTMKEQITKTKRWADNRAVKAN